MKLTITIDLDKIPYHSRADLTQEIANTLRKEASEIACMVTDEFERLYTIGMTVMTVDAPCKPCGKAKLK